MKLIQYEHKCFPYLCNTLAYILEESMPGVFLWVGLDGAMGRQVPHLQSDPINAVQCISAFGSSSQVYDSSLV